MSKVLVMCENCNGTKSDIITKKEKLMVRGEEIVINSNVRICECGSELFDEALEETNLTKAYDEYRKRYNILSPAEIKKIREKYGLPQRTLGRILGWGEVTIHRYETGALPDSSHNKMLKLLENPEVMRTILIESQSMMPKATFKRAIEKIGLLLEKKEESDFISIYQKKLEYSSIGIESGYMQINFQKVINSILFFSKHINQLWQTKLNKLLFYSDFKFFKEYTNSITGLRYVRFEHGPVPENYDGLLSILKTLGFINIIPAVLVYPGFVIQALVDYNPDIFTREELNILENVKDRFGMYSSADLSEISHKEKGWIETPPFNIISYDYASELSF